MNHIRVQTNNRYSMFSYFVSLLSFTNGVPVVIYLLRMLVQTPDNTWIATRQYEWNKFMNYKFLRRIFDLICWARARTYDTFSEKISPLFFIIVCIRKKIIHRYEFALPRNENFVTGRCREFWT